MKIRCPVCKKIAKNNEKPFTTINPETLYIYRNNNETSTNYYKCQFCNSLISDFFDENIYLKNSKHDNQSISESLHNPFIRHYIECGAGIDFMLTPIISTIDIKNINSYLEVGCGFGFNLDFLKFHNKKINLKGMEAADYGSVGASSLELPISNEYLVSKNKKNEKYDLIYSSEVIEHVSDPENFLRLQLEYLNKGGIIAFTTPNAEYVVPGAKDAITTSVLSPGFHAFVMSPKSIRMILSKFKIRNYKIFKENERLIVFLSYDFDVKKIELVKNRSNYLDYLKYRSNIFLSGPLGLGFNFRLFKELVNTGAYNSALNSLDTIENILFNEYNIDIRNINIDSLKSCKNISSIINSGFSIIGPLLYFKGFLNYVSGDHNTSSTLLNLSKEWIHKFDIVAKAINQEGEGLISAIDFHMGALSIW